MCTCKFWKVGKFWKSPNFHIHVSVNEFNRAQLHKIAAGIFGKCSISTTSCINFCTVYPAVRTLSSGNKTGINRKNLLCHWISMRSQKKSFCHVGLIFCWVFRTTGIFLQCTWKKFVHRPGAIHRPSVYLLLSYLLAVGRAYMEFF